MALFSTTTPLSFRSSSSLASPLNTFAATAHPFSRLCNNPISSQPKSFIGYRIHAPFILKERGALIAKASSDVDGTSSDGPVSPVPPSDSREESTPVENLPLESKLQQKLEQKMKMKLAKKIRLRRKRLVRKRHLRKMGRWPPSKLKKNKNV